MLRHLEQKQSHEFFIHIENYLMNIINKNLCTNQGFWTSDGQFQGCYVHVDVKVNDFYIPEWLRLNLESARKRRGVHKAPPA